MTNKTRHRLLVIFAIIAIVGLVASSMSNFLSLR